MNIKKIRDSKWYITIALLVGSFTIVHSIIFTKNLLYYFAGCLVVMVQIMKIVGIYYEKKHNKESGIVGEIAKGQWGK